MKVCLIIGGRLKKLAGLEKHFIELTIGLSKFFDISVIAHESYRKYFPDDINFITLDLSTNRFNPIVYVKLYKILKANNFDIVHAQANKATFILSKLKRFFDSSTKFIASLHNKKKDISYFNKMDLVIGVSDFVCKQVKTNSVTIYNGLDMKNINKALQIDIKELFHIKNDYPTFVSVGRLVKAKGFDLLIEAVKDLDINLIIVGDGQEEDNLNALIKKYNKTNQFIIAGFRDDALNLMKSSDGVIISSRFEGFSYVFAEALCLNKPLISTDVADIKKFIPNETLIKNKEVVSIKEQITYFLENKNNIDFTSYYQKAKDEFLIENMIVKTKNEYLKVKGIKSEEV